MFTFPNQPHPNMSDRYVMIDTNEVISNMADLGYQVAEIKGPKARSDSGIYGFHMVDFRRPEHMFQKSTEAPRILFVNSYNGTVRARSVAGLIRWVCSNGLVAGNLIANEKVTHIGDAAKSLIERIKKTAEETTVLFDSVGKKKAVNLNRSQVNEFTLRAVGLAFEEPDTLQLPAFSMPRRAEDTGSDLWTVFNRVQENLVRGGIPYVRANGTHAETSPIRDPRRLLNLNQNLWDMMEDFAVEQA